MIFYKRSSKPVMRVSIFKFIEDERKEYKKILEEGWNKISIFLKAISNLLFCRNLVLYR